MEFCNELQWAMERGRIDIYTEVSLLSQHLALPGVEYLEAVYHDKSSIIFDPTDPVPITPTVAKSDWSAFYDNLEEELPPRIPEALGYPVNIHVALCQCESCGECCDLSLAHGNTCLCSEFTNLVGKSATKYCGNFNTWE